MFAYMLNTGNEKAEGGGGNKKGNEIEDAVYFAYDDDKESTDGL